MVKKVNIPLIDLKREYAFIRNDIDKELNTLFRGQKWVLGPEVEKFEESAARYLNVEYTIGVASGTDALLLSLRAFAFKFKKKSFFGKKDEIITTPFTFIATAEAILRAGARPVFVDIGPDTFNISPRAIKKAVTKNTVGIIPVHLYGLPADMGPIMKIARKYGLFVLEDTAQAFGAIYKGKKTGTIGTAGAFSFFPSKNLAGYGDAGLIVTNSRTIYDYIKALRNHGQKRPYRADYLGYNSRLDSLQAAVLLVKLKHIDKFNRLRRKFARVYRTELRGIKQINTPLERGPDEKICSLRDGASPKADNARRYSHVYHLYTIRVSAKRDELLKYLNSKGIGARVYYPVPLHKMRVFKNCKISRPLKNTRQALSEILTLPINPFLKYEEIKYIANHIRLFFRRKG